jgi:DNA repair protein RecN (Recombination protein N)
MLAELKVANFAIINSVQITFQPGLNILSGETGAGKSVLLKSLALLMGDKAESETVRTGADSATIEGYFDLSERGDLRERLEELGISSEDDAMIVRRVVSRNGKGRVYINGVLSPVSTLRELVTPLIEVTGQAVPLIEMTGQHDNRHLMSRAYHLELLDQYSGTWQLRQTFAEKFSRLIEIRGKIQQIRDESRTRAQRLDFLIYQRDEIDALKLIAGEDVTLENEVRRVKNSARLSSFVEQAESALYGDDASAISRLHTILQRAQELTKYDPQLPQTVAPLGQAKTLIEDVVYELRSYMKDLDADPESLDSLEKRLSDLRQLQKKYGNSVDEILSALERIQAEIGELENSETHLKEYEKEQQTLEAQLRELGQDLSRRRREGAKLLEKGVHDELEDLNMKGLLFRVRIEQASECSSTGYDEVEFMTQTSKSDQPRALGKFASGGELSRILLSIKQVIGHAKFPRTYLFDEVDTGVSGPTAEKVGRKLHTIAKGQQVICITHLPQVASFGDVHFYIQKTPQKNSVQMEVVELKQKQRVEEIARLISGEKITQTSLAHAQQLLETSQGI